MGIPRFFKYISDQYPTVAEQTSFKAGFSLPNAPQTKVDCLYLDANGILHNCAREIYFPPNKPNKPRLSRPNGRGNTKKQEPPAPSRSQKEYLLFKAISTYMDQLLKFVKPQNTFYIAIDGPAPLAKQAQQRQRRYKSADEKSREQLEIFDTTAITPGTTFMFKLSKYLRFYIRKMLSVDPVWQNTKIIFSGPEVAGEGEHKIVEHIRQLPNKDDLVHCMYGLDADLFMLSLSTHCPKFYLLREDQFTTSWNDTFFYKVDIGTLRNEMFNNWGSLGGDPTGLINDFIFAGFLVGNDFLHALPACHDLSESINFIMDLRKEVLGSSYITSEGSGSAFNLNNLAVFLAHLASTETEAISAQYYRQNFPNITVNSSLKDPQHADQGIDLDKFRELYYRKAGVKHDDKHEVWAFCRQYVQGLEWVNSYYHSWPKNWQWYFPFHYSPLLTDVVDYLTNASSGSRLTRVSNKYFPPILPFQQLLCVVPPKSKALLPKYLQPLYEGSLQKYYPKEYKIDLEGKTREWEGIALLPFIEFDRVCDAYNKAEDRAAKKKVRTKFSRNTLGQTVQFWYTPNSIHYNYSSDYGHIKNCHVSYKLLT